MFLSSRILAGQESALGRLRIPEAGAASPSDCVSLCGRRGVLFVPLLSASPTSVSRKVLDSGEVDKTLQSQVQVTHSHLVNPEHLRPL